jgi:hypothetical protein
MCIGPKVIIADQTEYMQVFQAWFTSILSVV